MRKTIKESVNMNANPIDLLRRRWSSTDSNFTNVAEAGQGAGADGRRKTKKKDRHSACVVDRKRAMISIDWFAAMMEGEIKHPIAFNETRWLSNTIVMEYQGGGAGKFQHHWKVYDDGEHVANVLTHPQQSLFLEETAVKLELENHVFYSNEHWLDIYDTVTTALKLDYKNMNRLDIALDGVNSVHGFLNEYNRRILNGDKSIMRKNKRTTFTPLYLNENTMTYKSFHIGKESAHKFITVYEKKQEIRTNSPHKQYIINAWESRGMDTSGDVYRCELRMHNDTIKELDGFDIYNLADPAYLVQIFQTVTENFFEFVENTDKNISRCKKIDLLGLYKFGLANLKKVKRYVKRGCYKARLNIHNSIANILLGKIKKDDVRTVLKHVKIDIEMYGLEDFIRPKIPDWITKYRSRESLSLEKRLLTLVNI